MRNHLWVLLLVGLCGGFALAGDDMTFDDYIQLLRNDFSGKKMEIVTNNMTFAEGEAAKFWPVYRDYERDTQVLNDKVIALVKEYAGHYNNKSLTDAIAKDLYAREIALEKERIALKEKYFQRLSDALPVMKVVRFFQIDSKLQAALAFKIADEIPLVD